VAVPQKKLLGNLISEEELNWMCGELGSGAEFVVRVAFEDTLHAENRPAGSAAAMLAVRADRANSRRLRRKVE